MIAPSLDIALSRIAGIAIKVAERELTATPTGAHVEGKRPTMKGEPNEDHRFAA